MRKRLLLILSATLLQSSAFADVTLVRTFTLADGTNHGTIEAQGVTKIHGTFSRKETRVRVHRDQRNHVERLVTVVSLDEGLIRNLDIPNRAYQQVPLVEWRKIWEDDAAHLTSIPHAPAMKIEQSWYKILPVQEYKIYNGFRCQKFMYVRHLEMVNPETYNRKEYRILTTQWLADGSADISETAKEEGAFLQAYSNKLGGMLPPEDLNYMGLKYATELTGASEDDLVYALTHSMTRMKRPQGYPVFSQSDWYKLGSHNKAKPLFSVRSELKSVSLQPLPNTVFRISKDFVPKSARLPEAN